MASEVLRSLSFAATAEDRIALGVQWCCASMMFLATSSSINVSSMQLLPCANRKINGSRPSGGPSGY